MDIETEALSDRSLACVHMAFIEWASNHPHRLAVVSGNDRLTYAELDSQSNALAHELIRHGVVPDTVVVVCLSRSLRFVVAVLAIHKAGGAYLPIDPSNPAERIDFVIRDSGTPVIITERDAASRLPTEGPRILCLEDLPGKQEPRLPPACAAQPQHLAYVLYTSGSTGQPKGVQIEHRALANLFQATARILGTPRHAVWLATSNFSFDISIQEFLWPLCHGQTVVIFRGDESGESIPRLVIQHAITHFQGTPSRAQLLLEEADAPRALGQLKQLLLAGEALLPDLISRLKQHLRGELFNLYGPTETTIYSAATRIDDASAPVPIGHPVDNTDVLIVDEQLREIPRGEIGELLVGGAGLARGYLNRPDLTQARFIAHPLDSSRRVYRTGDLVRYRVDGRLDYLGRLDHQVKIRGHRIELGEIETRLRELPAIHQAAVLALPAPDKSLELVAYLTARDQTHPTFESLRSALGVHLPEFFIPKRFILLPEMPMTASGKTDRKVLSTLAGSPLQPAAGMAPRDTREQQLVKIWRSVLGLDRMGIHDDFFELGGHSLLAMRIAASIRRELGASVAWSTLFQNRTVAQLAEVLRQTQSDPSATDAAPLPASGRDDAPLSPAQAQMCFLHALSAIPAAYNVSFAYRLHGNVDLARLGTAWSRVVRNHEILRTCFTGISGELRQRLVSLPEPLFEILDLTHLGESERHQELNARVGEVVGHSFDLSHPPLWRVMGLRVSDVEAILVVSFQHSLVDEWAVRLIFDEWADLYSAAEGMPASGQVATPRYSDYSVWQQQELLKPASDLDRAFWRAELDGVPADLRLPTDAPRPVRFTFRGGQVVLKLDAGTRGTVEKLAREEGCSAFMAGLLSFHILLARLSGQRDIVVATPISLRARAEFQNVVGFFLNLIPIRLRLDPNASFRHALRSTREEVLASFAHGTLPSSEIIRAGDPTEGPGDSPLFRFRFVLLNKPWPAPTFPGVTVEPMPAHTGTAKADLALFLTDDGVGGWRCELEYAEDLFRRGTAEAIGRQYQELLVALVRSPDDPLSVRLPGRGPDATESVARFNPDPVPYPRDIALGSLFSQVARSNSGRTALVEGRRSWTYAQLDVQTNRLAHLLRKRGVSRGIPVGVHLERSAAFVVAVLAILKADGVYVPFPPEHPPARLRQLADELSLRYVLAADPPPSEALPEGIDILRIAEGKGDDSIVDLPDSAPESMAEATDAAYVMFTSGSTGVPKGVTVPHRAIVRLVHGTDFLPWGHDLRFLHLAPVAFDASTLEIWGPLLHGGTCVVCPERLPTFDVLARQLRDNQISCLWLTAGLFNQIIDHQPETLRGVKFLLTGGEALSVSHVRRALAALPDTQLINGYGPTEATTFTTTYLIPRDGSMDARDTVPIGRPVANTRCHVLSPEGRPVPPGEAGELYIGGDGVALGYWNHPDLSAEAFIPDPFHPSLEARLYRSGDRVRWLTDGNLEFLGRLDDQVKIRGFRIEPREVESILKQHPGVGQVCVFVRQGPSGKELVACYETGRCPDIDDERLRTFAERRLPAAMIPTVWSAFDQFPLTANGKIDQSALREESRAAHASPRGHVAPRNSIEKRLADIWERVLGRAGVGVRDDFFAMGGHSLLAMRLTMEIGREFGVTPTITDILSHATIEGLAEILDGAKPYHIPIEGSGGGPVLFFIPGVAGMNHFPDAFREGLSEVGRFCDGLHYPGVDGTEAPKETVQELAAAMIRQLRSVYPTGRVCLAGYSLGGSVAHEMACSLEAAGEAPPLVLLYDAAAPGSLSRRRLVPAMVELFRCLTDQGPRALSRLVRERFLGKLRSQRINLAAELGLAESRSEPHRTPPEDENASRSIQKRVFDASFRAAETHQPRVYGGRVVLFRSGDPLGYGVFQECDRLNGWGPYVTGGIEVEKVPGDHWAMLRMPGVNVLAERTAFWLRTVSTASSPSRPDSLLQSART